MSLKDLRQKSSLTQAELGKKIGRKQVTISQYESGIRKPDLSTARNLAIALNVTLENLLDAIEK